MYSVNAVFCYAFHEIGRKAFSEGKSVEEGRCSFKCPLRDRAGMGSVD
jgi:hypothetical protein